MNGLSFPNPPRRNFNQGGFIPPLPDSIPHPEPGPLPSPWQPEFLIRPRPWPIEWPPELNLPRFRALREGCYLIRYTPSPTSRTLNLLHYDGTMRVQRDGSNTIASGDLYLHRVYPAWPRFPRPWFPRKSVEPDPARGIPIFPGNRYRYYLRVTKILEGFTFSNRFTLAFERHRFDHSTRTWTDEGELTAEMSWTTAPANYPSGSDYLTGVVKNGSRTEVGTLTMGWVSAYLRRAVVEIDRVQPSEAALNNGNGLDWRAVFDQAGWEIMVEESDSNVAERSGESWSNAELHAEMLDRRDAANPDREWRYHLLCVRRLDATSRGIMYDAYGGDSNNIPREGAAISSHWTIPDTVQWGLVAGMRFGGASAPYFRTAVHEIGHAQGLYHNTIDDGFMNTTGTIAGSATPPVQFPDNIQWAHAADDQKRLRHMPDVWVRPGGISYGQAYSTSPISPDDMMEEAEGIELRVSPLLDTLPIGAPVRVNFSLINTTNDPLPVPASLSMKRGHVKGRVMDPSGTIRTFSPLIICVDEEEVRLLDPGKSMSHSVTLLRGAQGALFPSPGSHRITIEVTWDMGEFSAGLKGETNVMVTPPVDMAHAKVAHQILSTPDALLTLAIGGDHLKEGVQAIQAALGHPVLKPHFALIEAKRVGTRFRERNANFKGAAELLDETTVMSPAEIKRAGELVRDAGKGAPKEAVHRISQILGEKVSTVEVDEEITTLVKSL